MDDTTRKTLLDLSAGLLESTNGIRCEVKQENPHPEVLHRFARLVINCGHALIEQSRLMGKPPKPNP